MICFHRDRPNSSLVKSTRTQEDGSYQFWICVSGMDSVNRIQPQPVFQEGHRSRVSVGQWVWDEGKRVWQRAGENIADYRCLDFDLGLIAALLETHSEGALS